MNTHPRTVAAVAALAALLTVPSIQGAVATDDPVDTAGPVVVEVFGAVGDSLVPIAELATLDRVVNGILLKFSEPMWNPEGDDTPHDVTNAAGYMVLATGPYRGVATSSCDEPWIDETIVPITAVTYQTEDYAVRLSLDLDAIADVLQGQYRVILCDGGATDQAGNQVEGVEPQAVLNQMWRTFRVDSASRFTNSHFDCDVDGWQRSTGIDEDWAFSELDVNWGTSSGSGVLDNLTGAPSVGIGQCVAMSRHDRMRFRTMAMLTQAVDERVELHLTCTFYSAELCQGSALGEAGDSFTVVVDEDGWVELSTQILAVDGTSSAACSVVAVPLDAPTPVALDEVTLDPLPTFSDDFEMANFSRWSYFTSGGID